MKIKSRAYAIAIFLMFFILLFCLLLYFVFSDFVQIRVNLDTVILCAAFLLYAYLIHYLYMLFRIQNYVLEIRDNDISYTSFFSRNYKYSDINRMFWTTLKLRSGGVLNIIKLKFTNGSSIVFCVDKIGKTEKDFIITTLRSKVRRDFNCREWKFFF